MKHDLIVCGGTFDLLHKGHKKFIKDVLSFSDKVLLGITSNSYISQFKTSDVEDFEIRKNGVTQYLDSINAQARVEIVSINSAYEPLLETTFKPQVIGVTSQTQKTARELNKKRKELGLPELEIVVIEMEKAEDGNLISSTRIRNGEINRDGRLYIRKSWLENSLKLPQSLRSTLQKPLGKLLSSIPQGLNPDKTVTIGDITTKLFNENYLNHFISIVDFAVHRKKKFEKLSDLGFTENIETITAENPAGSIMPELFDSVRKAMQTSKQKVILVNGEEDLSFLPAMLASPLGFKVYYGQPDEGLVEVKVTEENKEKIYDLVNKFDS